MPDQLSLLDWQPVTLFRKRGPATSKAAARRAQPGCSRQCNTLLQAICASPRGLTRQEACEATGILNQSACARISELIEGGYIEPQGTREGPFGDQVMVYHATAKGKDRAKVLNDLSPFPACHRQRARP